MPIKFLVLGGGGNLGFFWGGSAVFFVVAGARIFFDCFHWEQTYPHPCDSIFVQKRSLRIVFLGTKKHHDNHRRDRKSGNFLHILGPFPY